MAKKKKVVSKTVKKNEAIDWKFIVLLTAICLVGLSVLNLVINL
jgi:hypothetical protein